MEQYQPQSLLASWLRSPKAHKGHRHSNSSSLSAAVHTLNLPRSSCSSIVSSVSSASLFVVLFLSSLCAAPACVPCLAQSSHLSSGAQHIPSATAPVLPAFSKVGRCLAVISANHSAIHSLFSCSHIVPSSWERKTSAIWVSSSLKSEPCYSSSLKG